MVAEEEQRHDAEIIDQYLLGFCKQLHAFCRIGSGGCCGVHETFKLRGCDVVSLKVEDVAPHGLAVDRATVRQKKTGHPVRFELTEQTRQAIDDYLKLAGKRPGDFLFTSRRNPNHCMSTRQYAEIGLAMGRRYRTGFQLFRHPFLTPNQGDADISPDR